MKNILRIPLTFIILILAVAPVTGRAENSRRPDHDHDYTYSFQADHRSESRRQRDIDRFNERGKCAAAYYRIAMHVTFAAAGAYAAYSLVGEGFKKVTDHLNNAINPQDAGKKPPGH